MRTTRILICVLLAVMTMSCSKTDKTHRLMVSVPAQKWLLQRIAGDKFDVDCMADKAVSAESFDPDIRRMTQLEKASAYFLIGNLAFENTIADKLRQDGTPAFNTSADIDFIAEDSAHSDGDTGYDPHVWMSVGNMRLMAKRMLDALVSLDSANKSYYTANFDSLDRELKEFSDSLQRKMAAVSGRSFVVWHPSLTYFARDYRLTQISMEYEGKEAPAGYLQRQSDEVRSTGARLLLVSGAATDTQCSMATSLGLRIVEINPLAENWKDELLKIADELTREDN